MVQKINIVYYIGDRREHQISTIAVSVLGILHAHTRASSWQLRSKDCSDGSACMFDLIVQAVNVMQDKQRPVFSATDLFFNEISLLT